MSLEQLKGLQGEYIVLWASDVAALWEADTNIGMQTYSTKQEAEAQDLGILAGEAYAKPIIVFVPMDMSEEEVLVGAQSLNPRNTFN